MLKIHKNSIELIGKITSVSDIKCNKNNKEFLFFDIVQNEYIDGKISNSSFYKIRINKNLITKYNGIIAKGNNVYVKGFLNSYNKNDKTIYYIYPTLIKYLDKNFNLEKDVVPIIDYDEDGNLLWNGKRQVSEPMDEETKKELEEFIHEFS